MLESIIPLGSSLRKNRILSLGLLEPDCTGAGSHALRYSAKQVALHSELKKITLFFKLTRKEKKGGISHLYTESKLSSERKRLEFIYRAHFYGYRDNWVDSI